jgi:FkbM family methyltransferase
VKYYSQYRQDKFVDKFFNRKNGGFFVDIGAHDGVTFSNTFFLEKEREWTGICIEPIPDVFDKLILNRRSININSCITQRSGIVTFRRVYGYNEMLSGILELMNSEHVEQIENDCIQTGDFYKDILIESKNINEILNEFKVKRIDYLSIDTEGAEYEIIKTIDFDKVNITFLSIENNNASTHVKKLLIGKGYKCISSVTDDFYLKTGRSILLFKLSVKLYHIKFTFENSNYSQLSKIKMVLKILLS